MQYFKMLIKQLLIYFCCSLVFVLTFHPLLFTGYCHRDGFPGGRGPHHPCGFRRKDPLPDSPLGSRTSAVGGIQSLGQWDAQ